ncbi:MAG: hypothetical protein NTY35_17365 [Planctomycetota bacterium]|nr:hypothetical protein [Planctomycetota bacterium]
MKPGKAGLWVGIASACLAISLALWDTRAASPGPISSVHAISAGIDGDDCEVCHGGSPAELRAACAACHADVEAQVANSTGFHGTLSEAARCGRCHSEHHGAEFELAGAGAFALAGVSDRSKYAHEALGFELSGDHTRGLACRACHENADAVLLADGAHRFLGESQACASCHDDPHAGKLADCRSCHGETEPFAKVAEFQHPATFALAGAHGRAGCVACHPRGTEFAIEAGGSEEATRPARTCEACHASPHAAPFVQAVAARLSVQAGASCVGCHTIEGGSFQRALPLSPADHAATGFALDPPHDQAACTSCHPRLAAPGAHAEAFADYRVSHPGRSPDACAACHADPHGGQFGAGPFAEKGCLACHARERFDPPTFGVEQHALTKFALTGRHADAACRDCHPQVGREPRAFHGTDTRCSACHADAHAGFFAQSAADPEARGRAEDCSACHTTSSFSGASSASFDHARWTGYPLVGAHAESRCDACHARRSVADDRGRSFGTVAESYPGPRDDCATCHVDPHGGFFARRPEAPACTTCHTPHGFEVARGDFDHARWAGFALEGAHGRAACDACHAPRATDASVIGPGSVVPATRRTIHAGDGSFQECSTCHADVHAGVFDGPGRPRNVTGRASCARCHSTDSFAVPLPGAFDHATWTRFELTGAHSKAECASCHPRDGAATAQAATYGRAPGTRCADCHADPHAGQFARGGSTDCAQCHATAPSFLALDFDHQHDARFALDTTHAKLACSACHVPWPLPGGGSAVRYKPLGVVCGDCHAARRGGQ